MQNGVLHISYAGKLYAIIVRREFHREGIEFFTPRDFSQQLAYMNRDAGHTILPHRHNQVHRNVTNTLEVLFVRSGRLKVDFYDERNVSVSQSILKAGDVVLLAAGGHGFTMLEPTEIIEVKQGPYAGDQDKTLFEPAQ